MVLNNSLTMSHEYALKVLHSNAIAIDATAGNGYDTLFLANHCKSVYSFDIQQTAIEHTRELLLKNNISNVELIFDSHERLNQYVTQQVDCIMFNLGYLPGGPHQIETNYKSTIIALKQAMKLLKKNGLITIVIYQGQDSGFLEKEKVLSFLKTINESQFIVMEYKFCNQSNHPPVLTVIEKK